jgi:hypothetical protein
MTTYALVFLCQLSYVCLLGIQSRNVRDSQYLGAAMVSTVLGVMGLYMTTAIAKSAIVGGDPGVWIAYIGAGPLGICLAMWLHNRFSGV